MSVRKAVAYGLTASAGLFGIGAYSVDRYHDELASDNAKAVVAQAYLASEPELRAELQHELDITIAENRAYVARIGSGCLMVIRSEAPRSVSEAEAKAGCDMTSSEVKHHRSKLDDLDYAEWSARNRLKGTEFGTISYHMNTAKQAIEDAADPNPVADMFDMPEFGFGYEFVEMKVTDGQYAYVDHNKDPLNIFPAFGGLIFSLAGVMAVGSAIGERRGTKRNGSNSAPSATELSHS